MTKSCMAPDPNTKTPEFKLPPNATDAHCHIFGPGDKYPYSATRTYTPPDAGLDDFKKLQNILGLNRAVLVNASCHGTNNDPILDAIAQSGGAYRGVANINHECWQGLKYMHDRDLVRDFNLAKELNIEIKTPFLDKDLIAYAMKLPGDWKIQEEKKKVILREVAEEFLGEFAWRKKKAAQYGSCFDKAINKLTRKNGFKLKKDYLDSL